MCRFLTYAGEPVLLHDLLYRPEHSLIVQSYNSQERDSPYNADGFGIAWYVPEISPAPAVFRSLLPAWSNPNLKSIASLTRSGHVFAHVRAASEGDVSEMNCHPFASGNFLWMHNGTLAGYAVFKEWIRRYLSPGVFAQIRGTTDSELLFALFLDTWGQLGSPTNADGLAEAFRKSLRLAVDILQDYGVKDPSTLNIALTDGKTTLACRYRTGTEKPPHSLYLAKNVRLAFDAGRSAFEPARERRGVLVASERLFPHPSWEEVPPSHIVVAREGGDVSGIAT